MAKPARSGVRMVSPTAACDLDQCFERAHAEALAPLAFGLQRAHSFVHSVKEGQDHGHVFFMLSLPHLNFRPVVTLLKKSRLGEPSQRIKSNAAVRPLGILQNLSDAFISGASWLEPGRICMIMSYSQIASSRPKPMRDVCVAL
jgi:hypothetical protein